MLHPFDAGAVAQPFTELCADYPEGDVYPTSQFRTGWGPVFHRGRLNGSARILVVGQDPAQHETIVRRTLVGEAGRRVQGLLTKLGIVRSYVFINTYLYSVFGSVKAATRRDPRLIDYRHRWLDALLIGRQVEAVVALGGAADEAWQRWKATPAGSSVNVAFAAVTHPTQPESFSKGNKSKLVLATQKLLQNWNQALVTLAPSVLHPDVATAVTPYGETWAADDRVAIPGFDLPAGLPAWMHEQDGWAQRKGANDLAKRRNITLTVPKGVVA